MEKILFFVNSFTGGGAEHVCINLANAFHAQGYEVQFVTIYKEGDGYEIPPFIRLYSLGLDRNAGTLKNMVKVLFSKGKVNRFLKGQDYVLITSHLPMSHILSSFCTCKKKTLYVMHSSQRYINPADNGWYRMLLHAFLKGKHVVTVSEGLRGELISHYKLDPAFIHTVYNPVRLPSEEERLKAAKPYPKQYILMLGRLEEEKRPLLALKIYERAGIKEDYDFVFLGNGSLFDPLKKEVEKAGLSDHVYLAGFQKNPGPWLAHASLLLTASSHEGFPMNMIEALSYRTPVVASNCNYGPSEILTGDLKEFLIDPEDPEGSAAVVRKALSSYPPILEDYYQKFSDDRIVKLYLETYAGQIGDTHA